MDIIKNPAQLTKIVQALKCTKRTIGFVPTMGALHEGHATLIRRARAENDIVVASIFVNPKQFGPHEDFKKYPRPLRKDLALCRNEKVDYVFHPSAETMYPRGSATSVNVEGLGDCLCAASRPGHFRGVATVVTKLFNIAQPDTAYFGQKDAQQALIIRRMASDLNIPVKIAVCPIAREADGLAISSRNIYLSDRQRRDAPVIFAALQDARVSIKQGERNPGTIITGIRRRIDKKEGARIDYVAVVDADTLKPLEALKGRCLIAAAVWFGTTRLIDNCMVSI